MHVMEHTECLCKRHEHHVFSQDKKYTPNRSMHATHCNEGADMHAQFMQEVQLNEGCEQET